MSEIDKPRFRRVVRREKPSSDAAPVSASEIWTSIKTYFGFGRKLKQSPIDSPDALARLIDERASFVAQTSLYGYLRTRAGMRYPELFDDDAFVASINIAKWHLWLDCLTDLAVYAGSRIAQQAPRELAPIREMMQALVEDHLARVGLPAEAGETFMAMLLVDFAQSESEEYLLPIAFASDAEATRIETENPQFVLARVEMEGSASHGILYDAAADPRCTRFLFQTKVKTGACAACIP